MLPQVLEQLAREEFTSRKFVLHWAQPHPRDIQFMGTLTTLPGRDDIAERDPAFYPDGDPIPGTVVLFDRIGEDEFGTTRITFDALKAVHYFMGIQPRRLPDGKIKNGAPRSPLYKAGLSVLPGENPTRDQVQATLAASMERVEAYDYEYACRVIFEHDSRNAQRVQRGMEPISGGKPYHDAVLLKRDYEDKQARRAGIVKEVMDTPPASEEDMEFEVYMRTRVEGMAAAVSDATDEQKAQVVRDYIKEPKVRAKLYKEFVIRKRGYTPETSFKDETMVPPHAVDPSGPEPPIRDQAPLRGV